jgi:hypothetical protein
VLVIVIFSIPSHLSLDNANAGPEGLMCTECDESLSD